MTAQKLLNKSPHRTPDASVTRLGCVPDGGAGEPDVLSMHIDTGVRLDRKVLLGIPALVVLAALVYGVALLVKAGQPGLAGSVLTAATTVIISTMTLVAGRYFERKCELEAFHRDRKIPIYGKFLSGVYETFQNAGKNRKSDSKRVLNLILEWQREITLWGGSDVVGTYNEWKRSLNNDEPNAHTVFMTENLISAIRKELGHDNIGIEKGAFVQMILREANLFLAEAAKNPDSISQA